MAQRGYESLQLAMFFDGSAPAANAASLWSVLFADPYASFAKPTPITSAATGLASGITIELQLSPNRIDLIGRLTGTPAGPPPVSNDIGTLSQPLFDAIMSLVDQLEVSRIAAIATYREQVGDAAEASRRLLEIVPGLPISEADQDVTFQVSRRRKSAKQSGLEINRLCRWSTTIGIEVLMQIVGGQIANKGPEHHFVEHFVDANTHPAARPRRENISDIYGELLGDISNIVDNGLNGLASSN